jgi:hypothetical protein
MDAAKFQQLNELISLEIGEFDNYILVYERCTDDTDEMGEVSISANANNDPFKTLELAAAATPYFSGVVIEAMYRQIKDIQAKMHTFKAENEKLSREIQEMTIEKWGPKNE